MKKDSYIKMVFDLKSVKFTTYQMKSEDVGYKQQTRH